jgi:uncharacterized protein YbjQ (UPF0145 family)
VTGFSLGLIQFGIFLILLTATWGAGTLAERRHYKSIRERELRWRNFPAITFRKIPGRWVVSKSTLVGGNVVISLDYFKRFLASIRMIFGGRIKSYESLLDRARREALLRLKESAVELGYHAVVNVRLETSRIANARGNQGIAGLEVLAYGTAVKLLNVP